MTISLINQFVDTTQIGQILIGYPRGLGGQQVGELLQPPNGNAIATTSETLRGDGVKPEYRIDNWQLVRFAGKQYLEGDIYGHPRVRPSGGFGSTSRILEIDEGLAKAETKNSIFHLGKPRMAGAGEKQKR